ncbi:LysR family transcriptional regulator [Novosphingobium terrae]|uniref:LysR family transcriptional regulator n=1 Tax=Novosphingobium terrae TaxID=2726189 RepID=UPI001F13E58F|nr:LysR family transcriptional regulator [Novosphingobium terrae]
MIDARRLRYFLAVAGARSFTRAAEALHMAQPPLSKRIQELEADIGTPLFDREARPLALTPAGRLLFEQGMQIDQRMEQMALTMRQFVAAERRRLVLGLIPSAFHAQLPDMIRRYRLLAPDVEVTLSEMTTLEQIAALKDRRIDAALGRVRIDDDSLAREVLRDEPMLLALPIDHPQALEEGPADLRLLEEVPLIVYPKDQSPSYADLILSQCRDHGLHLPKTVEVREMQTALILVAAGMGACIVPESARLMERPEIRFRPIRQPMSAPIILYHREGDNSYELRMMYRTCAQLYAEWGRSVPDVVRARMGDPDAA